MIKKNLGFSLIEVLGALAIGGLMTIGLSAIVTTSMEDIKGQQTAYYQAQVTAAAAKYVSANYAALSSTATDIDPEVITLSMLVKAGLLSTNIGAMNPYDQTPCVLVLKTIKINADNTAKSLLHVLVVTEGGKTPIDDVNIGSIAAKSGQGGGYISLAASDVARGAYNLWSISASTTPKLASFLSKNCSGMPAAGGHLANALFYDGPDQVPADYLYRNAVSGRPEYNQMRTPIHMDPTSDAKATEDSTDSRCTATKGTGMIAVDTQGKLLTCQGGTWKRSGNWQDPKDTFDLLPKDGNAPGDVRMVTSLGLAFMWDGSKWAGLSVDADGNMVVPETLTAKTIQLNDVVAKNESCSPDGQLARDSSGSILSCQSGKWRSATETKIITPAALQVGWRRNGGAPVIGTLSGKTRIAMPVITLADLPGPRPLYMTGWMTCHSHTNADMVTVRTSISDASGNGLALPGMCTSQSYTPNIDYETAANIPLMKIPENAATINLYMEVGSDALNEASFTVLIFNSE